jgi:PAS domain S-box-containing protein
MAPAQDETASAVPRVRTKASEAASETAFALLDALWHGPVGIAVVDRALRFVQVNDVLASVDGVPAPDHLGRTLREVLSAGGGVSADAVAGLEAAIEGVIASGRPRPNVPARTAAPRGRTREWLCSFFPVTGPSGEVRGVCALVADATDDRERQGAIERAHAVAQRTAGRLALLQDVTAALSAASDLQSVAAVVTERVREALGAAGVSLRRIQGGALALLGSGGLGAGAADGEPIPLERDLPITRAVARKEGVWLESPEVFHAEFPAVPLEDARRAGAAFAAIPLVVGGTGVGVLALVFARPRAFDGEERAFVTAVARQCAQALERAALFEAERAQRARAQDARDGVARLLQVTAALSKARTAADVLSVIVVEAQRALGVTSAVTYSLRGGSLELNAAVGGAERMRSRVARLPLDTPIPVAAAARTGTPQWLDTRAALVEAFPRILEIVPYASDFGALAALPLVAGGDVVGSVAFAFSAPRTFGAEERALLVAVAEQAGVALDRARLLDEETEHRALLDAVLENAPVGIAFFDHDLRFRRVNPALAEMNGFPVPAHLGKAIGELLPGLPVDEMEEAWRSVLATGEPVLDHELAGETPAAPGKRRVWLESWYPVRSGGKVLGLGALVREVTAERDAQEFQRNVLGIVGHDLRNPLAALVTSARLLLRAEDLTAERARLAARIFSNADRMDRIISVLLDYARLRGGQGLPLHRQPCDLAALVDVVADECEAAHPGREVRRRGDGDPLGDWDHDRLAQVLANVVANALDHGAPGTPVEVAWHAGERDVVVEVTNEGAPIPAELLPRLFEPFRRGEWVRRGGRDGLGLGLFIARSIVEAHGGRIEARAGEAGGAVFTIRLPRGPLAGPPGR